jgi:hypothetical protein
MVAHRTCTLQGKKAFRADDQAESFRINHNHIGRWGTPGVDLALRPMGFSCRDLALNDDRHWYREVGRGDFKSSCRPVGTLQGEVQNLPVL